jgi:ankyrin repeat protein
MTQDKNKMLDRIANGRTDLVFDYLEQGHSISSIDSEGASLIRRCAYHGDVSAIRFLLSRAATLDSLGGNLGLDGAAFHGHWQLCEFLLENGANVNQAEAGTGETPLHVALCKANRPACDLVIEVLLAHGANPNCATRPLMETGCLGYSRFSSGSKNRLHLVFS